MVDPISDADRARALRWAKIGLVLLVGISTGLISVQGDAPFEVVVGSIVAGLVVGAALVWYLFPDSDSIAPASSRRYRK